MSSQENRLRVLERRIGPRHGNFRGRKVVSPEKWWERFRAGGVCLGYLPDRCIPFVEYSVERFSGWLHWLVDYHDLMVEKEDKDFLDWSTHALGALLWVEIELRLVQGGNMGKVHAEMMARGQRRECLVCGFPDIVDIHLTEFGVDLGLLCFCKDHTKLPESEWDMGGRKYRKHEFRSRKHLCRVRQPLRQL